MMLSRLVLNPRNRQVQREIAEPYQMHRTIMSAFPDSLGEDERVLFRLESLARSNDLILLVQSQGTPNWGSLVAPEQREYLLPVDGPNPWVKPFEPEFHAGQRLIFRLRANPTVKRRGKRHALYREEEQLGWLQRKAESGGFSVEAANIRRLSPIRGSIFRNGKRHDLTLFVVEFDGLLQVTDPDRFLVNVQSGIGSGKGVGCGLLSVAPGG